MPPSQPGADATPTPAAASASGPQTTPPATTTPTDDRASRPAPSPQQPYTGRSEVPAFVATFDAARGLDPAWSIAQIEQARYIPAVAKLMMPAPSGTAKDWATYRARFVEPKRIAAGAAFWRANEASLDRAYARWGVPPWLVVGIVGVETYYGRITGGFRVIDALATLGFDFPAGRRDRSPFFRAQIEEYLHWCRREGIDPQSVLGSYAGAIGLPQFMPGSINRWAIDFDDDGHIDLLRNHADVIGSVAHYMAAHGWQRDMPAYYEALAPTDPADRALLLGPDIVPSFSADEMRSRGAVLRSTAAREHRGRLALVELENGGKAAPSYVAGTENFYVVTRYNWSSYYAMAVIDLGLAVQASLREGGGKPEAEGSSRVEARSTTTAR